MGDYVVHMKKKVVKKGKAHWVNANYVRLVKHALPGGKFIWVKAGTQVIDRAWRFLRSYIANNNNKAGSDSMARAVRSAQWVYWHRHDDLWAATGRLIQDDA